MRNLAVSILWLSAISLYAQSIGELRADLKATSNDSLRVSILGHLAVKYARSNPDSAVYFGKESLRVAKLTKTKEREAAAFNALGNTYFFQSRYDSCIKYWNACYNIAATENDSTKMSAMLNNLGLVYSYKTEVDTAVKLLLQARVIREKTGDERITSTLNNLGNVYQNVSDWDKALEYYLEAADLKKKYDQRSSLTTTLNNIAIVSKKKGDYDGAIQFYKEALQLAEEFDDRFNLANAHNNLAALYHDDPDQFRRAGEHYESAISLKTQTNDRVGLANSYANYADWLAKSGRHKEAWENILKAERLDKEVGLNFYTSRIGVLKASVLNELGRPKEAYQELSKAYGIKIQELTDERNEKIAELETRFDTEKREAEIVRLSLEGELKDANLARARNAQYAMAVGGSSLLITLIVFFTLRHKKVKAEREAQELQVEALKKRFMELHASPAELAVEMDFEELNQKLHTPLTEREFDALKLSIEGKSNPEISDKLFISVSTVKFHLRNAYSKMGVGNRKEAFQFVLKSS